MHIAVLSVAHCDISKLFLQKFGRMLSGTSYTKITAKFRLTCKFEYSRIESTLGIATLTMGGIIYYQSVQWIVFWWGEWMEYKCKHLIIKQRSKSGEAVNMYIFFSRQASNWHTIHLSPGYQVYFNPSVWWLVNTTLNRLNILYYITYM